MNFKISIILKSHWPKILSVFLFIILLSAYANIFAIGNPYGPGQTLDPLCAPLEENCTVSTGPWLTNSSGIYYGDGNVSVGNEDVVVSKIEDNFYFSSKVIVSLESDEMRNVPAISMLSDGSPVFAYYESFDGPNYYTHDSSLYLILCNDSECSTFSSLEVDSGFYLYSQGRRISLKVDLNDFVHISYNAVSPDYLVGTDIKYSKCNISLGCSTPEIIESGDGWNTDFSLDLDENNNPHIIHGFYNSLYDNYSVSYSKYTGSGEENSCFSGGGLINQNWKCKEVVQSEVVHDSWYGVDDFVGDGGVGDYLKIKRTGLPVFVSERHILYENVDDYIISYHECEDVDCNNIISTQITNSTAYNSAVNLDLNNDDIPYVMYVSSDDPDAYVRDSISIAYYVGNNEGEGCDYSNNWTCKKIFNLNEDYEEFSFYHDFKIGNDNLPRITSTQLNGSNSSNLYTKCRDKYCNNVLTSKIDSFSDYRKSYNDNTGYYEHLASSVYVNEENVSNFVYIDFASSKLVFVKENIQSEINLNLTGNDLVSSNNSLFNKDLYLGGKLILNRGVYLQNYTPENKNNSIYNDNGSLYWGNNKLLTNSYFSVNELGKEVWIGDNEKGDASHVDTIFLGNKSGYNSTYARNSNFIGTFSGYEALYSSDSNFIGALSGYKASNARSSVFLGSFSGYNAENAGGSIFIGDNSGYNAENAGGSIFIGRYSGYNDTVSVPYNKWSILIGPYTKTGGYINSILIGGPDTTNYGDFVQNTKNNQFMISPTVTEMRLRNIDYTMPSVQGVANSVLTNNGSGSLSWGSPLSSISSLSAANKANTINNIGYSQTWQWNSLSSGTGLLLSSSSSLASGNTQKVFQVINSGSNSPVGQTTYSAHFTNIKTGSSSTNVAGYFSASGGTNNYGLVVENGNVGIGTVTPNYRLFVGNNTVSGIVSRFQNSTGTCDINPTTTSLVCSSDITLKKNITTLEDIEYILNEQIDIPSSNLEKLLTLTPVKYNWNSEADDISKHTGFIAQEVEQLFPELVSTDENTELKSISYSGFTPYIVEAIKELNLKVEAISLDDNDSNIFSSVIKKVENGIAYLTGLVVDTIVVGSQEKRTGITLYDEETGSPYCITIVSGEIINREGECGVIEMPDICPNIDEYQQEIPDGYELDENNECIEVYIEEKSIDLELEKKVDVCSNIEGMQSNMPEGYNLGGDDECIKQDLKIPVDPSSLFIATPSQE